MELLTGLLVFLFVIVCISLVLAVLLQPGKGEGLIGMGGLSTQLFGGGGALPFLAKVTTVLAILYGVLVIALGRLMQPVAQVATPTPAAQRAAEPGTTTPAPAAEGAKAGTQTAPKPAPQQASSTTPATGTRPAAGGTPTAPAGK
jgi:preprotein translocase subunit SecG